KTNDGSRHLTHSTRRFRIGDASAPGRVGYARCAGPCRSASFRRDRASPSDDADWKWVPMAASWSGRHTKGRARLPMQLPFTGEQFFDLLAEYNAGLWPALVVLWTMSVAATMLLFSSRRSSDRWISALLALHWMWSG